MGLSSQGRVSSRETLYNCLPMAFRPVLSPPIVLLLSVEADVQCACSVRNEGSSLTCVPVCLGVPCCICTCFIPFPPPLDTDTWSVCKAGSRGVALTA